MSQEHPAVPRLEEGSASEGEGLSGSTSSSKSSASTNIDKASAPREEEEVESTTDIAEQPPLPQEPVPETTPTQPPLPTDEPEPGQVEDDGWDAVFDNGTQAWYFYNRFTGTTQWDNPRVAQAPTAASDVPLKAASPRNANAYNPAIHGDYDPNADYAIDARRQEEEIEEQERIAAAAADPAAAYAATGTFNRFTGKWQAAHLDPSNYNDENKSSRQLNAYFDVNAAANSHDGRSLKAERSGKKLSKAEVKAFQQKRREKKEEKRRAWLRD